MSLDSLDPERFARITRGGRLEDTLAGLDAAFAAGFSPIKINTLLLPGVEDELDAFVELTRDLRRARALHRVHAARPARRRATTSGARGGCCRPATCCAASWRATCWSAHDGPYGHGPAQYWKVAGARGTIGFIAGVSEHFCETCNRLRLTADGRLRTCLFSGREVDVRPLLNDPAVLRGAIETAVAGKTLRPLQRGARQRPVDVPDRRVTCSARRRRRSATSTSAAARPWSTSAARTRPSAWRAPKRAVVMAAETLAIIVDEAAPKGDVIAVARLAGIMAAKRTHELIPLCHQLNLTKVAVDIEADEQLPGLRITTEARLRGRTGVEMEALVAASVAALTVYDMCKAVDRGMQVTGVRLLEKSGGRSGHWRREASATRRAGRGRSIRRRTVSAHQVDGTIVSVNVADKKGVRKQPVESITLVVDHGVEGDAHAGPWHRQVSLLANESIEKMLAACPTVDPGAFGENVTTEGLVLYELPVGTRLLRRRGPARGHPDRQGVPRPLRDLPPGRRLRDAARGHLRQGHRGRRDHAPATASC